MTHPKPPFPIPFVGESLVARWPEMVPRQCRRVWKTDRRSFSFNFEVGPEAPNRPLRVVVRNNAVVFEVKRGSIEVSDGLERVVAGPSASAAVSLRECWISPIEIPPMGVQILTHIVGTLPFRSTFRRNPAIAGILDQLRGTPPGIFYLGERHPERGYEGILPDSGEQLVASHFHHPGFLRFVASIPKALNRPEARKSNPRRKLDLPAWDQGKSTSR